jgi:hypothetical protein
MGGMGKRAPRGPSPYKGHPRSEWPALTAKLKAEKATAEAAAAMNPDSVFDGGVGSIPVDVPRETSGAEKFMQQVHQPRKAPDANFRQPSNVSFDVPIPQPASRVSKPNLFNGKIQKLVLVGKNGSTDDPIPGYRTHWFVDQANSGVRINQAKASGWEFINSDEVALNEGLTPGNNDLGSHVRQIAGTENGAPFYMYAMKKPLWLEQEHQAQYAQTAIEPIKEALLKGRMSKNASDRQFSAGDSIAQQTRSGLPPIEIGSKIVR